MTQPKGEGHRALPPIIDADMLITTGFYRLGHWRWCPCHGTPWLN